MVEDPEAYALVIFWQFCKMSYRFHFQFLNFKIIVVFGSLIRPKESVRFSSLTRVSLIGCLGS